MVDIKCIAKILQQINLNKNIKIELFEIIFVLAVWREIVLTYTKILPNLGEIVFV